VETHELVVAGMLLAVAALLVVAYATRVPYPIWLVLGGAGIGFVPGVPDVRMEPDLVLLVLLPPLLYAAAFFSSLRDLQRNARPIGLLSVGLVLFTMFGLGAIAHLALGLPWNVALVLGAVLSPTDPVAATAIARRVGAPQRVITVVEGESLVNDSSALIAYRFAVAAVVSGSFSLADAGLRFVGGAAAGIAIGLAIGWLVARVRARVEDPTTEIALSLLTPYFAYLPAEAAGASAVLAAVTSGIYLGWNSPRLIAPDTRIQAFAVWRVLVFALNAALFTLVGLQLPAVLEAIAGRSPWELVRDALVVAAAVMVIRFLWVFPVAYMPRLVLRRLRGPAPAPPWRRMVLVAWTGMRGAVSLAAALAIPVTVDGGGPFPQRDLIVFLVYATILATLLVQGLSLPWLVRVLGVAEDGDAAREAKTRMLAAEAGLRRLDELQDEPWVREDTWTRMHGMMDYRRRRFAARFAEDGSESASIEERSADYQRLVREVLEAQRRAVIALRDAGHIGDELMHRIERDLDLEDSRLDL
jgi:CPA1 family monovalent cation:H+ antiporter